MEFVEQNDNLGFSSGYQPKPEKVAPTFGETVSAAATLDSSVLAAYNLVLEANAPPSLVDFNFSSVKRMQEWDKENGTNLFNDYRANFLGARNDSDFLRIVGKIKEEQKAAQTLEQAGMTGTVLRLAMGIADPTLFIPFIGQAKGTAAVAKGAALVGAGTALQEIPLQMQQETRTAGESALAISAGTVLGGILGGAVSVMSKGELSALTKQLEAEAGTYVVTVQGAIPGSMGAAAVAKEYAGKLKDSKAMKTADWLGPVSRVINQDIDKEASWGMSQLSDSGGLRMEGNVKGINTSEGGTVESLVKPYYGQFAVVTETLDQSYAKHIYGENSVPGLFPNLRAGVKGLLDPNKFSKSEFREEVTKALFNGDLHEMKEVAEVAKDIRTRIFDPMLKEAQNVKLFGEMKPMKDASYFHRMYDTYKIKANQNNFIELLSGEYAKKLNEEFGEKLARLTEKERRDTNLIADLVRPKEEVAAMQEQFTGEKAALEAGRNADLVGVEDQISALRSQARLAAKTGDKEAATDALAQAKELEKNAGKDLSSLREQRAEINRRLAGLSKAASVLEERQLKKFTEINKIDDFNFNQFERIARTGQKVLNKLETVSDKELGKLLKGLGNDFAEMEGRLTKSEGRVARLLEAENPDMQRLLQAESVSVKQTGQLSDIAARMEELDTIDRAALRNDIREALELLKERSLELTKNRIARQGRLEEAAAKLSPEASAARLAGIKTQGQLRRETFLEKSRLGGAANIDFNARTADFAQYARELATDTTNKIIGTQSRIPLQEILSSPRGAEMARVLDIESNLLMDYLEKDVEKVIRAYLRTMAPDIELKRKFGSVTAQPLFDKMIQNYNSKVEKLGILQKEGKMTAEQLSKEESILKKNLEDNQRDLNAVIGRLRGTWGIPDDPDAIPYRMGKAVMNLNVLRLMGGTLISSIPDAARVVQRYGLTRTFRDGFTPLITNLSTLKLSAREAKLSGGALDAIMHTRAQSVNDVLDDYGRHSKFERGLEYATNQMGAVALFDKWTVAMKQFSASVIIGKMTDSLDIVVGGVKANAKDTAEAIEFLAAKGLNGPLGRRVYDQLLTPEGGNRIKRVLYPNTEAWVDAEATRVFRGALASEMGNTIITPGVERPLWIDSSMTGRMLGQFKSFGMSSTYKILLSGIQQRDAAFFNGTMVSFGLGALSYYLSAVSAGGESYEKMLKAPPGKWADEAIARSGILGIFSDGQRFLERIPATQPYVSFSGDRTSRRGGDGALEVILGPSYGLAKTANKVLTGLDEPTQSTLKSIRQMMPWQNLILWRNILDEIEKNAGQNLPEKRN
jgi:NAD(P)-dependent dehydrogenase (short-subunit alcohol dehydrogenase family)